MQEAGIVVSPELRETIRGSWKKYSQIQGSYQPYYRFGDDNEAVDRTVVDNVTAMELSESLQGHRTGWCTAGTRTAAHQLSCGDFYVYYSEDKNGDETVPRVAIRMEDGQVAEVRGIEPGQGLESVMVDITERQLRTLPGGGDYFERLENMKHMTDIYNRQHAGQELTADDIMFLRFTKGAGEGFGQYADPRLAELLKVRDFGADLKLIVQAGADPTVLADQLISQGRSDAVAKNINAFLKAGASREEPKTMLQSGYDA